MKSKWVALLCDHLAGEKPSVAVTLSGCNHLTESPERTADETDSELRRVCSLLESIAQQYSEGSPESLALQDAARAYILVHQRESLLRAYQSLKAASGGELTVDMIATLRQVGIAPDDFGDDD